MASFDYRPVRLCDSCAQTDNHPRHTHGLGPDEPMVYSSEFTDKAIDLAAGDSAKLKGVLDGVRDTSTQVKHLDCCAADGCPDQTCVPRLADVGDLRREELVAHFEKQNEGN
jgi:hypothetical protein